MKIVVVLFENEIVDVVSDVTLNVQDFQKLWFDYKDIPVKSGYVFLRVDAQSERNMAVKVFRYKTGAKGLEALSCLEEAKYNVDEALKIWMDRVHESMKRFGGIW
jgi:hypothetical protein